MFRKTFCLINEKNLCENVANIRENYSDYKYCIAVVKGNAYGHGMQVVNALVAGGADYIAVATLEEALKVRKYNSDIPVLCLEPICTDGLKTANDNNVTLTVSSLASLTEIVNSDLQFKIHLKLDTGMHRLGFDKPEAVKSAFDIIGQNDNLQLEGIYTHLATSGVNDAWYDSQIARFKQLTTDIDLNQIPIVHIDRSITLVHHKKAEFVNGMRLGICMYGFAQSMATPTGLAKLKRTVKMRGKKISQPIFENSLRLKTAMSLYSEIIEIKRVKKGEFIGYGAAFTAIQDMNVATIAIGYYDGMNAHFGSVYCGGKKCPIIGELCMDMTFIEVDGSAKVGDRVEIFGDNISVREASLKSGLSAYRLLTGITSRVPRVMNGKEYEL
ncbi:MAG: alanine racemase [Clostridia bacterium]|nr:alanine racemase [Clostridia bacterium]